MLVNFYKAAEQDQKPTVKTKEVGVEIYPNETVLLVVQIKDKKHIIDFHGSRPNKQSGLATTLYGEFNWNRFFPEIGIGFKTPLVVTEFFKYSTQAQRNSAVNHIHNKYGHEMFGALQSENRVEFAKEYEPKPRPEAFPQDFLGNSLLEDKHEKVNPLDERMERLLVEIQSSLILAGGCHKAKHYDHSFKEVMRSLLSNVDKKTLVRIIENAY